MAAIEIRSLHKTYRAKSGEKREALAGLDLVVDEGTIFGFVGPNGAGKSTALKILVGLIRPSSGEALLFGSRCGTRESRRKLGFLPEVANYHEFMGVQELLNVHAALAGVSARERPDRCQQALATVGLEQRARSRLRELSKGMRQRFGIAQALVGQPPLLILDELTSGLDPLAQSELKTIVLALKAQGITIFFSSHHMAEVESVCDRVGIIHLGKLRACGSLSELSGQTDRFRLRYRMEGLAPEEVMLSEVECQRRITEVQAASGTILSMEQVEARLDEVFRQVTSEAGSSVPAGRGETAA